MLTDDTPNPVSACPACDTEPPRYTHLSTCHGVFMSPGAHAMRVDGGDMFVCPCGAAIWYDGTWFEKSSRPWLSVEQREALVGIMQVRDRGHRVTWKLVGEYLGITPGRARRLGEHLRKKGYISWHRHIGKSLKVIG